MQVVGRSQRHPIFLMGRFHSGDHAILDVLDNGFDKRGVIREAGFHSARRLSKIYTRSSYGPCIVGGYWHLHWM